jgi:hypothetical protein
VNPRGRIIGLVLVCICSLGAPSRAGPTTARRILDGENNAMGLRYSWQGQTVCGYLKDKNISVGCVTETLFPQKQGPAVHAYLYDGAGTGTVVSAYLAYRAQMLKIVGQNMQAIGLRDGAVQIRSNPWLTDPAKPSHAGETSTAIDTYAVAHDRLNRSQPLSDLYRAAAACRLSNDRLKSRRAQPGFVAHSVTTVSLATLAPPLGPPDLVEMIGGDPGVGYALRSVRRINLAEVRYTPAGANRARSDALYLDARSPKITALEPVEGTLRGNRPPAVAMGDMLPKVRSVLGATPFATHLCGGTQLYYGVASVSRATVIVTVTADVVSSLEVYDL